MEEFKIELYEKENDKNFPDYESLTDDKSKSIQIKLRQKLKLSEEIDLLGVVKKMSSMQNYVADVSAKDESFRLTDILQNLGVEFREAVFINWFRFDDIDQMNINDLSQNLDDIWFAGADDIDVFDESLSWILSIRHDGSIYILN